MATFKLASITLSRTMNNALLNISETMANNIANGIMGSLVTDMEELHGAMGDLSNSVNSSINGVLTTVEKNKLDAIMQTFKKEVSDINAQYDALYKHVMMTDVIVKGLLKEKHDIYVSTFNELVSIFDVIMAQTSSNIDNINIFNAKLELFKSASVELGKVMNQALLSISNSTTEKEINDAKNELQGEINDVSNAIGDLNDTMNGAFKEGILSIMDVKVIQDRLVAIDKELLDISGQFQNLYYHKKLSANKKKLLYDCKTQIDLLHQQLKGEIEKAIIDYIISQVEIDLINTLTNRYNAKLVEFNNIATECIEEIAKSNSQEIVDGLDQEAIFNKLTNNGQVQGPSYLVLFARHCN